LYIYLIENFNQSFKAKGNQSSNFKLLDIDGDGFIDATDLDIFLKRYGYIEDALLRNKA